MIDAPLCDFQGCEEEATINIQECLVRWYIHRGRYSKTPEIIENHGDNEHWCDEHYPSNA